MHLCQCLVSLVKKPHVNLNIKKQKFQKFWTNSTFLYVSNIFLFFLGQPTISNLASFWWFDWFKYQLKCRRVFGKLRTNNKNTCDIMLFSETKYWNSICLSGSKRFIWQLFVVFVCLKQLKLRNIKGHRRFL